MDSTRQGRTASEGAAASAAYFSAWAASNAACNWSIAAAGFRRCGLPVVVNARGDILVRPSYFERSVMQRCGF